MISSASLGVKAVPSATPYVDILVGGSSYRALVDSGSARSLISLAFFNVLSSCRAIKHMEESSVVCWTASMAPLSICRQVDFKFKIEGFSWVWNFLVAENLGMTCILGADFIRGAGLVLDLGSQRAWFKFNRKVVVPLWGRCHDSLPVGELHCEDEAQPEKDNLSHLPTEQAEHIRKICSRFPEVLTAKLGVTHLLEYEIRLNDSRPVRSHPYKLAPPKMKILREMIDELLEQDVIEPSVSSYASPAFLVPKPNGKSRLVLDYRKLNSQIDIDSVPLPDLHSAFDWFGRAKYFSVFDLNQAYHQIPLKKESRHITSFCVPWNLYQFKRVPMGLAVGAQTLTRLLDSMFHDIKFKYVFNYLDDLLVYSETFQEHLDHLEEVLGRLRDGGLTVNPEKVTFARPEISFLGHLVSSRGVCIDPARTQGIKDFPPPKDAKGVARFVGMVNFYRRFIPNAAELAAPLNLLRKKGAVFEWGGDQQKSFELLKEAVMQPPVLRMPDFAKPFILQTDASSVALGAVLSQEFDGVRQPVAFASRTLSHQEKKASCVYELECLAVIFGVDQFRRFLEHTEFLLETDNQALSWLLAHPRQLGKLGRWIVKLSAFKFKVQHIKGTMNVVADCLSRMYHEPSDEGIPTTNDCAVLMNFPLAHVDLLSHQMEDPELAAVISELQENGAHPPYLLNRGVLCCRPRGGGGPRVVLPSKLIPMVFSYYHSSPVGGHLGIHKTIAKIRKEFIYRGMDRDIAARVRSCRLCSLSKPSQNAQLGLLSSEVAERPFEKVFVDYVGPFPRSKSGNSMLLVCVDAFSKFCWLWPLRRATAKSTIRVLRSNLFQTFGVPATLVSDNGPQFTSRDFHRMCFQKGIRHVTTSPYYPQPSHAERFNRNLKSALIAFHADNQDTWDENLCWLQLAFNSAQHESHKAVPFEVMLGYPPNNPLSNLWKVSDLLPSPGSPDVKATWEAARRNLLKAHARLRKRYNQGRKPNPFQVGDLVYCRSHPSSSAVHKRTAKLCFRWSGPHRILRMLTPVTAQLGDPQTGGMIGRAHVSHLKPFRGEM